MRKMQGKKHKPKPESGRGPGKGGGVQQQQQQQRQQPSGVQWNNGYIPPSGMTTNFPQGQLGCSQNPSDMAAGFLAGQRGSVSRWYDSCPMMVGTSQTPQPMGIFPSPQGHM